MNPFHNNYQLMLQESIDHFLAEHNKGSTDFSVFGSIFLRLVQSMSDPPLEITWFYSATTFHSSVKSVAAVKDLFQLLVSCSNPYSGSKKVAVLAPVVSELYYIVVDCLGKGLGLKGEVEGLIEVVVSYILLCCSNSFEEWGNGSGNLTGGFVDLIRVWSVGRVGERREFGDDLRMFFPLVSGEVRSEVSAGCGAGYVAGIVMVEAFLLRLCLKFGSGVSGEELQKDMQHWAVQTITGFQNGCFFDMLLRMLLEPGLPVTTILSSENEVLLRQVLYDVVILVDYSYLKAQMWTQLPGDCLKSVALTWLLVVDKAVQFAREICDQTRAISYIDAFSKSCLPNQLIKWFTNQTGLEDKISLPNASTPKALIRWLQVLEEHGVRVFGHDISKLQAKTIISKSRVGNEISDSKPGCKNQNDSIFFCLENQKGQNIVDEDQEMADLLDDAFAPAACMGHAMSAGRIRKRKEGRADDWETRFKLAKFDYPQDSVVETRLTCCDDNLNGGNDVKIQSMV
ncbi:hypothetical protein RHGRI_031405 [Rhododendron griersonianum]|uniref:Uncharacterized protein n=1 Tax=Rhododendron griersonianum TaxID=479676 RepID=A0AAV6IB83_9ERIC|nr:hypothetical protein RHGRI_031405 [Rhododendron griersonianum]